MVDTYKPMDFRTVVLNLTFNIDIATTRPAMDIMRSKMTLLIFKKVSPKGIEYKSARSGRKLNPPKSKKD